MHLIALLAIVTGAVAVVFPSSSHGEIIAIPDDSPQIAKLDRQPSRGMVKDMVAARFGEPQTRHAAVGDPPISRWDYHGFSVYFEYQHGIHTVVHARN